MGLFDLIFDQLSKEIREAPGWLSLVAVCYGLVLLPVVSQELEHLGMSCEQTTIATLVAMALFFVGDILDSIVFPREKDGTKFEKIFKTFMLLLGAIAVFLFAEKYWPWAVSLTVLWILIIPVYNTCNRPLSSESEVRIAAGMPQENVRESKEEMTGFPKLVWQHSELEGSKGAIGTKLKIRRGMYDVSKALARKADRYTIWIWLPNEAAKFIRSASVASLVAGGFLLRFGRISAAALAILASIPLLLFYCWLKGLHMRRLYALALIIVTTYTKYDSQIVPEHGERIFLFDHDVVAHVSALSLLPEQ